MNQEAREKQKQMGVGRFFKSFNYSLQGLKYAFKYEQNILIHLFITAIVVVAGIYFNISLNEWIVCILLIGLVIATEMINTSIEAVVDLACPKQHDLAKIAKDTASAAVLMFAVTAVISGLVIFLPKIIGMF